MGPAVKWVAMCGMLLAGTGCSFVRGARDGPLDVPSPPKAKQNAEKDDEEADWVEQTPEEERAFWRVFYQSFWLQGERLNRRSRKFCDDKRVVEASKSRGAALELAEDAAASRFAYCGMLVDALRRKPPPLVAIELIRGLQYYTLGKAEMELLCEHLDLRMVVVPGEEIKATEWLLWYNLGTADWEVALATEDSYWRYPAYGALVGQGASAVPIVQEYLSRTGADSGSFERGCRVLYRAMGKKRLQEWLISPLCGLDTARREECEALLRSWPPVEEQTVPKTTPR